MFAKGKKSKNSCYCAFCRRPRRVSSKKHLGLFDTLLMGVFSFCLMVVFWGRFEPKALIICIGLMGVSEFVIQLCWRLGMVCPHCNFDPILYQKNPLEASAKVENFLKVLDNSEMGFLKKPNLPGRQSLGPKEVAGFQGANGKMIASNAQGKYLSKQI